MPNYIKVILFGLAGAVAGYAYYYFIGCYNGQCMISSNPYISTGYGIAVGLVLGWKPKKKATEDKTGSKGADSNQEQ